MSFPKYVILLFFDDFVIRIIRDSFFERWIARIHDEKYDTCSKDIDRFALIFFGRDLWSHVTLSSKLRSKDARPIFPFHETRKSEVS